MMNGQIVRVRSTSPLTHALDIAPETLGFIVCCYRQRKASGHAERVDVRLADNRMVWGVAADQFEPVDASDLQPA